MKIRFETILALVTVVLSATLLADGETGVFLNGTELNSVTGSSGTGWTYDGTVLKIDGGKVTEDPTLSGTNTAGKVFVRLGGKVKMTFDNLSLKTTMVKSGASGLVELETNAVAEIVLKGSNTLSAINVAGLAAICCPYGGSLTLIGPDEHRALTEPVGSVSNVLALATNVFYSLTASGGAEAAAIGGARATCGDIEIDGVAMDLSGNGPHLIGVGSPQGSDPYLRGDVVLRNYPYGKIRKTTQELIYPRPHDPYGRPCFVLPRDDMIYLPTGDWTIEKSRYAVRFNNPKEL